MSLRPWVGLGGRGQFQGGSSTAPHISISEYSHVDGVGVLKIASFECPACTSGSSFDGIFGEPEEAESLCLTE